MASGQRRFWAYALHTIGAAVGICAVILTVWRASNGLVEFAAVTDAASERIATIDLGVIQLVFLVVVIPVALLGAVVAVLGLPILRGYRRSPVAWVLVAVAGAGVAVPLAGLFLLQAVHIAS